MAEPYANISGFEELSKFLTEMPKKVQNNVMRSALRAGMKVVSGEVKTQLNSNDHVKTGQLQKGLKITTRMKKDVVIAKLRTTGPHSAAGIWIEFGTAAHTIKAKNGKDLAFGGGFHSSVNNPGVAPKPFMRPALEGAASAATLAVGLAIKAKLDANGLDVADIMIEEEQG